MLIRLLGAMAVAVAITLLPVQSEAAKRELFQPQTEKQRKFTCAIGVALFGLHPACFYRIGASKVSASRAQVTIHKPESGVCQNGNTYRIMRVSNPRSVCKNSFKHGSSVPACTNISGRNGKAHSLIIVDKRGTHLAHEIRHACDVDWNH